MIKSRQKFDDDDKISAETQLFKSLLFRLVLPVALLKRSNVLKYIVFCWIISIFPDHRQFSADVGAFYAVAGRAGQWGWAAPAADLLTVTNCLIYYLTNCPTDCWTVCYCDCLTD